MFNKKKKPEEEIEELLPTAPKQKPKEEPKAQQKQVKRFSLGTGELALAITALADREEFILYQKMVLGQQIAGIIQRYQEEINNDRLPTSEEHSSE